MTIDHEILATTVRAIDRCIGLELQWALTDEDDGLHCFWVLALHAIVEKPGPDHSRYSTVEIARFPAEELEERREAHRAAAGVAALAEQPLLHAPRVEDCGGHGKSGWIRAQPAGPAHGYALSWDVTWWTDAGEKASASGTDDVTAESGRDANIQLCRELERRFPGRPMSSVIRGEGLERTGGTTRSAPWPADLPTLARVRDIALTEGCRPSAIARGLVARAPNVTPLALMVAFEDAFYLWFERLVPLAKWRKGELSDAELDAALPNIEANRFNWDRVRRLREAHAAGQCIAAIVRAERSKAGHVRIARDLIDAFDIPLGNAKEIVDRCGDPDNDAELDALLRIKR